MPKNKILKKITLGVSLCFPDERSKFEETVGKWSDDNKMLTTSPPDNRAMRVAGEELRARPKIGAGERFSDWPLPFDDAQTRVHSKYSATELLWLSNLGRQLSA